MNTQESIILGVISGVLTSALIFVVRWWWINFLTPWYQSFRYQGADISGSWFAEFTDTELNIKSTYSAVFKQSAHTITGSLQFSYVSPERKFSIDYNLSGEYWEGYLNLMCRSKDRKVYSHAAMFLKLINGGAGLLGQFCFRDAFGDKVDSMPLWLDRVN